jgi:hypothetical protein
MGLLRIALLFALGGLAPAMAQSAAAAVPTGAPPHVAELGAVTVSGVQPGPGLWKVSSGDHVLWVMGTLSPLPRTVTWQSQEVAAVIAGAQSVLLAPSVTFKANVGFFGKLFLLPAAYSARKNEDGRTLQQVLPPAAYARWLVLKQRYIGSDSGIERWRPLFAAQELYSKALKANALSNSGGIASTVQALASKHGIKPTAVTYQVVIDQPRAAINAFKRSGLDDVACFSHTLDSIEQDMPAMTARANAWASGDLQTLRRLPNSDRRDTCVAALTGAGFAHQLGLDDLPARVRATWLAAARTTLTNNRQSFALLPMDELLSPTGYLAALRGQGYTVEPPQDDDEDAAAAPATAGSVIR